MGRKHETITAALVVVVGILASNCDRHNKDALDTIEQRNQAIRLLRNAYDAFNRGEIAKAVEELDPAIEWTEPASFPGGGTYHGHAGVSQYLTQSRAGWAEGRSDPEKFIVRRNRVVVFVHARIRMKGSSEWHEVRLADVYTFREGRPISMRAFADREDALDWVGAADVVH
ncbi:MAG: nuclear transport factor 2 family protein [Bryobacteraceae bacterium]